MQYAWSPEPEHSKLFKLRNEKQIKSIEAKRYNLHNVIFIKNESISNIIFLQ